ncbi:MAG TPA: RNA polymerase sigma factor [Nannocystaceae bacterium]|nr:RNA polymerase sigma factor [Nannocystaceae bacterium]
MKPADVSMTADLVDALPAAASAAGLLSAPEDRLVERARAGDARALREIYDAYHGLVRAHLHRLLGSDSEIDDLVQIVFARAFGALDRFRGGSSLSTWLYRITANTTHNLLRQRYRRGRLRAALAWFDEGREGHVASQNLDAQRQAERLLQQLHPDLREAFVLYHYEGLTLHEIAAVLDKPVSTIGDRLSRARKRLHALVHGDA